jgi:hypothetical protein
MDNINILEELNLLEKLNSGQKYCDTNGTKFEVNNKLCENLNDNNTNVCLISLEKLDNNYISLKCGHKYNYLPIYNYYLFKYRSINYLDCPYCGKKTYKSLPVRKIDGKYLFNNNIKCSLNNCITDEHKCTYNYDKNICEEFGMNGLCMEHNKYFLILKENMKNNDSISVLSKKINTLKKNIHKLLMKKSYNSFDNLFDDLILDILNITQLRIVCEYFHLDKYINLRKFKKYELILFLKGM